MSRHGSHAAGQSIDRIKERDALTVLVRFMKNHRISEVTFTKIVKDGEECEETTTFESPQGKAFVVGTVTSGALHLLGGIYGDQRDETLSFLSATVDPYTHKLRLAGIGGVDNDLVSRTILGHTAESFMLPWAKYAFMSELSVFGAITVSFEMLKSYSNNPSNEGCLLLRNAAKVLAEKKEQARQQQEQARQQQEQARQQQEQARESLLAGFLDIYIERRGSRWSSDVGGVNKATGLGVLLYAAESAARLPGKTGERTKKAAYDSGLFVRHGRGAAQHPRLNEAWRGTKSYFIALSIAIVNVYFLQIRFTPPARYLLDARSSLKSRKNINSGVHKERFAANFWNALAVHKDGGLHSRTGATINRVLREMQINDATIAEAKRVYTPSSVNNT